MIKYLILIGLLALSAPFWLPTSLGGHTSYHFVLTDSMKGTVDPGSFVVVRRADNYEVSDIVGYRQPVGDGDDYIVVLHRIVEQRPDGTYITRGDARTSTEEVQREAIVGRMVLAVPRLGFLPGAFRNAPLIFGGFLVIVVLLTGGALKKKGVAGQEKDKKEGSLFIPAAILLLLSFPFASEGVVEAMGKVPLYLLLAALVAFARIGEVSADTSSSRRGSTIASSVADLNYVAAIFISVTVVPIFEVMETIRPMFSF